MEAAAGHIADDTADDARLVKGGDHDPYGGRDAFHRRFADWPMAQLLALDPQELQSFPTGLRQKRFHLKPSHSGERGDGGMVPPSTDDQEKSAEYYGNAEAEPKVDRLAEYPPTQQWRDRKGECDEWVGPR